MKELASEFGFERPVVVTFAPHVVRARYIFQECYGPDVSLVAAQDPLGPGDWLYQYAYQSASFVKNAAQSC